MDAHMHFDLYKSRQKILDYIESNGSYTIAVTNLPELYERYYQQYDQYKYIKIALGFHPELVFQYMRQIEVFRKLVTTTRYIGEVGLDFTTQDNANRNAQRNIFSEIIDVCNEHSNKILSVHSRRAEKECLEVLKRYKGKTILHWYSGNINILSEAIERDYFFYKSSNVTQQ